MNERITELLTQQRADYPHTAVEFKLEEVSEAEVEGDPTATLTIKNTVDKCSVELHFASCFEIQEFIDSLQKFVERHQAAWEIGV
jgi:hypothetical protein